MEFHNIEMLFLPRYKTCPQQSEQSQPNHSERGEKDLSSQNKSIALQQKEHKKELKFTQPLKYFKQNNVTRLTLESSRELQFQNKLNQNRYTLNFSDHHKTQSLPKLNNIQNVRQTLISEDAFHHFKKLNTKYGRYKQALRELERIEQQKKYKLKLQNKMKIKTRKNIFEMQKSDNIEDIYDLFVYANTQPTKQQQKKIDLQLKKVCLTLQQSRKQTKMHSCLDTRWKLGDFFDSIIRNQREDSKKTQNIRFRLSFLSQVKKITNACDIIQEENNSKSYLKLFSKFSQNLNSNLYKKKRKLQKVQAVFKR